MNKNNTIYQSTFKILSKDYMKLEILKKKTKINEADICLLKEQNLEWRKYLFKYQSIRYNAKLFVPFSFVSLPKP